MLVILFSNYLQNLKKKFGPVFEILLIDHFTAPLAEENFLVFHIFPQKNRIVTKLCSHACNNIFELPAKFKGTGNFLVFHIFPQKNRIVTKLRTSF